MVDSEGGAQAPKLSEEIMAEIRKLTDVEIEEMSKWDAATKSKQAEFEARLSTKEGQEAALKEAAEMFAKHANTEGCVQLAEFEAYAKEHHEARQSRGEPDTEQTAEKNQQWYNVMSKVTPETTGVSMMDIHTVLGASYMYSKQKMGA